jgi:tetratricopeptide (TPR) repeat protein
VILYELLTGRTPFTRRAGPAEKIVPELVAERRKGAPEIRRYNKDVSPAAEAIVRKCLKPDPARRYQNARDLKEDLDRHLADLPLRHQPEPSRRERTQKWLRRNPRVRSTGAVTVVATVLVAGLATLAGTFMARAHREEAVNRLADFRKEHHAARALLYARGTDSGLEEEGRAAARQALALYGLPDDGAWQKRPEAQWLPVGERAKLREEAGQLLVLLAASVVPDREPTPEQKAEALRLNRLAEQCFGQEQAPQALWAQRAELVADAGEAGQLRELAAQTPPREGWDHYLAARALLRQGKVPEAMAETREAVRVEPDSFAAWFLLGNCCIAGGTTPAKVEAAVHYTTCASLQPDFFGPYFNRGKAYLEMETKDFKEAAKNNALAEADFTRALELRPAMAEAHLQRALARSRLGKYREAAVDADEALAAGVAPVRVHLMRSQLREHLGDREGARQDLVEGLLQTPLDCPGWIDRGKARLRQKDVQGALADFAAASRCNPLSREAVHDQAYVLGELSKRPADAIPLVDRELELHPNQPVVIVSRGVYHAQLGQREAALADAARAAEKAPRDGEVLYRAACVYALTSRQAKDSGADRRQAIGYLARALECGFGFDYVDSDTDLEPLRGETEFGELQKLIDKTRKLKGWL